MRIRHDLFDSWTEESAYILGFWFADGGIKITRERNRYGIKTRKQFRLFNTDKALLMDIANILNTTSMMPIRKEKDHHKQCYRVTICSNTMYDFCHRLIGSQNKSGNRLSVPNLPVEVLRHFVRGFFDGDGTIFIRRYKMRTGTGVAENLGTGFTAGKETGDFLQELKALFIREIGVSNRKIIIDKATKAKKLMFSQGDSAKLCEWMYENATIYMHRKKDIWDKFDKQKIKNNQKYAGVKKLQ